MENGQLCRPFLERGAIALCTPHSSPKWDLNPSTPVKNVFFSRNMKDFHTIAHIMLTEGSK
jgi:hypothetical protein